MALVEETSPAPKKGLINQMKEPFGFFLYNEKLISWNFFFFFFDIEIIWDSFHFYVIERYTAESTYKSAIKSAESTSSKPQLTFPQKIMLDKLMFF